METRYELSSTSGKKDFISALPEEGRGRNTLVIETRIDSPTDHLDTDRKHHSGTGLNIIQAKSDDQITASSS